MVIKDVILRLELDIHKCRGQAYDGAANMSGAINGVQSKLKSDEPRALFVHCFGHSLNLVVQDCIVRNVVACRDVVNDIREIIQFVRSSTKRLQMFVNMQSHESGSL
jgi:hypothetical protein